MIAATCSESVVKQDTSNITRILSKLDVTPAIVGAFVYDTNGRLLAEYNPEDKENIPQSLPDQTKSHYYQGGDINILHVFSEIIHEDRPVGTVYLWASGYELKFILTRYLRTMLVMLAVLFLMAYLLARRFQRYISDPIRELSQVAKEISNKPNIDIRAKKQSSDEIGSLFDSFNDMLDHIHQRELGQRAAEEQARHSLEEKEVLLKEIHHRVKNNMQVIVSLLNLQSEHLKDEKAIVLLQESKTRIRAMALVHEKLYQSSDLGQIHFGEYIQSLAEELQRIYYVPTGCLDVDILDKELAISVDRAVPCGLILNELLTNAFKYGFPNGFESGQIVRVELASTGGMVKLTVSDSGEGFPAGFSYTESDSLGLTLVRTLTEKQLRGTIQIEENGGVILIVQFPVID